MGSKNDLPRNFGGLTGVGVALTATGSRPSRLIARLVDVRPGEGRQVAWAFVQFLALLSALYIVRPLRDEMGIESGVDNMQWLFSGTFVAIVAVMPAYGWAVSRWPRRRLVPAVYLALALSMGGCFAVIEGGLPTPRLAAAAVFVWISVFNVLVVSIFWSLLADLFAPEASRRLFGFIAAGGTIGALLGPTLAATLVHWLPPNQLLLIAAGFLALGAGAARKLDAAARDVTDAASAPVGGGVFAGLKLLLRSPRMRGIAGYLLCMTWISTIVYFEQAHIIDAAITDRVERTSLFARIDLTVNVLTLGVQALLTGTIIVRAGLTVVLVALPLVSVGALGAVGTAPALGVVVVVQVIRRAVNFALAKPAREILFTDVDVESKYKTKNVIDTVVYRGGDAVAGWAFSGLLALGMGMSAIAWLGVPIALLWAGLGRRLGKDATPTGTATQRPD